MDNGKNDLTGMEETWRGKDRVDSREKWQDLQHFCHHHHYHNDDDDDDDNNDDILICLILFNHHRHCHQGNELAWEEEGSSIALNHQSSPPLQKPHFLRFHPWFAFINHKK